MLSKAVTTIAASGVLLFASQSWACGGGGGCCFYAPQNTTATPPAVSVGDIVGVALEVASLDVKKGAFTLLSKQLPQGVSHLAAKNSD